MTLERRQGGEFRVAGRTLTGRVMTYGDISPDHQERFLPGAFGVSPQAALNIQHDPGMVILKAGEFVLADSATVLEISAELPSTSAALALVKRGALSGFSIEFHAKRESRVAGLRVVEQAELTGIALVDQPSYPASKAEVRRGKRGLLGRIFGRMRVGVPLDCTCSPGGCRSAFFKRGSFQQVPRRQRDILAVVGDYSSAVASRDRGSLKFRLDDDGALAYTVDIPDNSRGRSLMDLIDSVDVFGRPVIDLDASDFVMAAGVATYSHAEVRAVTIGATDASSGWVALKLETDNDDDFEPTTAPTRRRSWLP